MPLAVIDLSLYFISVFPSIPIVQLLNLSDLGAETSNFFAKHCEMIHTPSIAFRTVECRSPIRPSENKRWSSPHPPSCLGIQGFYVDGGSSQEQTVSALQ